MENLVSIFNILWHSCLSKSFLLSCHSTVFLLPFGLIQNPPAQSPFLLGARSPLLESIFFSNVVAKNGQYRLWFYFTSGLFMQVRLWLWAKQVAASQCRVENPRRNGSWGTSLDPSVSPSCRCLSHCPFSSDSLPHFASIRA